jgi:tRNA A-37 threonylcarbamoyl transferase component Bud32
VLVFVTGLRPTAEVLDRAVVREIAEFRTPSLTRMMRAVQWLGADTTMLVAQLAILAVAVAFRRFRHALVLAACILFLIWMTTVVQVVFARPRPLGVPILGTWKGFGHPSRAVVALALTLVGGVYALVPQGKWRVPRVAGMSAERQVGTSPITWVCGALLGALALAEVYLAVENPSDVILGGIMGVAVPLVAFRIFVPAEAYPVTYRRRRTAHVDVGGRRGEAIKDALADQLGVKLESVEPFALEGSWGSTPVLMRVAGEEQPLFGKIYTATHLRSDRWYKLGRTLLYGRLEDEAQFGTVRRLVEYEDYLLRLMAADGLPVATCHGFVEITPEREYLIVAEFLTGAREIGDVPVDEAVIDDALAVVRRMWDSGLAHRDIKPANVLVRNDEIYLVDVAFAEVRPSPWRQAVDLANMMLVLALSSDPETVYARARRHFSDEELAEAFAAARGVTMPGQLRSRLREDGRDCLGRFRSLAPYRPPIAIQHWSLRRLGVSAAVLAAAILVAFGALNALRTFQGL